MSEFIEVTADTKTRRERGEGSLYKHANGSWVAQITLSNGTRKTVSGRTKAIAVRRLNEIRQKISRGENTERNATPLGEFLRTWVEETARISVRKTTLSRYRCIIRLHILPSTAARIRLDKLAPMDIQSLYAEVADATASPRTVRYVHQIIHKAFNDALTGC